MTTNFLLVGLPETKERHLTDGAEHTIVAPVTGRQQARSIESILVTATASDTITIRVRNNSGVVFAYATDTPVTVSNDYHKINHLRILKPEEWITAEAGTGTLWIGITTVNTPIQQGPRI